MGKIIEGYEKNNVRLKKAIRTVLISFIVILIMLLVVGIVVRIQKMVLLPIKEVRVYGTGYIKNSEILNAINLDAYRSILSFSKKRAKASILQDKRISGIEIVKVYPGTLRVYIAEKEEKITLNVNDRLYRLSADGIVLTEADRQVELTDPLITLSSNSDDINIGSPVDNFMVRNIMVSINKLEKEYPDFYENIKDITVTAGGVYIQFKKNNYKIYLGKDVTIEKLKKLRVLFAVLKSKSGGLNGREGVMEIDMSFSHAAVRGGEIEYELQ